MSGLHAKDRRNNEKGAILVVVALLVVFLLIALIAFALDVNHLYVVRNELQNASDAGALAGAKALYVDPDDAGPKVAGEEVNAGANQVAFTVARANLSDNTLVDVNWTSGNTGDVQRGHWSFARNEFTPSDSLVPIALWGVSDEDLDNMDGTHYTAPDGSNPVFINAVKVISRRKDTPAISFFAKYLGFEDFIMQAEAVGYIGFAGSIAPREAVQPIVICDETLRNADGEYECNIGRMLDSGASCPPGDPSCEATINTAGWTDMTILDQGQCTGTASAASVKPLVCIDGANSVEIQGGDLLQATNGVQTASYNTMQDCWINAANANLDDDGNGVNDSPPWPDKPYPMTLPVVDCGPGRQVDNCVRVVGVVTVNMLFMSNNGGVQPEDVPVIMNDPDPEHESFRDWSYAASCNDSAHNRDFTALVGQPTSDALTALNGFMVLSYDDAGNPVYSFPADTDRWLAAERWQGKSTYTEGMARWDCFVDHFKLINTNGKLAPLNNKAMYFMPDCEVHEPRGQTGGPNFGTLADYPALVE